MPNQILIELLGGLLPWVAKGEEMEAGAWRVMDWLERLRVGTTFFE